MVTYGIKLIAYNALKNKYGFGPDPDRITLLESDGEGTYILFRVGEHEYRCDNGEITNSEDQKKLDEEGNAYIDANRLLQMDLRELREQMRKQEQLFATKELMLTEAYNAQREKIEDLKGQIRFFQSLADDRKKEIERLEGKIGEMSNKSRSKEVDRLKKENEELVRSLHYRDLNIDGWVKKHGELESKYLDICHDLSREKALSRKYKADYESVMNDLTAKKRDELEA